MRYLLVSLSLCLGVLEACVSTVKPIYQSGEIMSRGESSLILGSSDTTRDYAGSVGIDVVSRVAISDSVELNGTFRLPGWPSLGVKYLVSDTEVAKVSIQHLASYMGFEEGIGDEGQTLKRHVADLKTVGVVSPKPLFGWLIPYGLAGVRVTGSHTTSGLKPEASVLGGLGCELMPKNGFALEWGTEVPMNNTPSTVYFGVVGRMVMPTT